MYSSVGAERRLVTQNSQSVSVVWPLAQDGLSAAALFSTCTHFRRICRQLVPKVTHYLQIKLPGLFILKCSFRETEFREIKSLDGFWDFLAPLRNTSAQDLEDVPRNGLPYGAVRFIYFYIYILVGQGPGVNKKFIKMAITHG